MISKLLYSLARPALFSLQPEAAHHFTMPLLQRAATSGLTALIAKTIADPRRVMGLNFPNPIGLAAGLDKDGAYIDGLASLGFGFLEIGTVTPLAQPGNPTPRMFRLPAAQALINRMGFNNSGVEAVIANVQASQFYQKKAGILGLNIGKNATTPIERAIDDYLICLKKVYPFADYVTINISSPNTANLRQLQDATELNSLLLQLKNQQMQLADAHSRYVPIALKIAPDLNEDQLQIIADALLAHKIDGVIATNTTISRTAVEGLPHGYEAGGLSGKPVGAASTEVIRQLKSKLGETIPIIGVGGILSANDAYEKINAGASMVQLYTGLIYRGPALIQECAHALRRP